MSALIYNIILLLLYFYYTYNIGSIRRGKVKSAVTSVICILALSVGCLFSFDFAGWIAVVPIMTLFDLFYDEEAFVFQWYRISAYGLAVAVMLIINRLYENFSHLMIYEIMLFLCFTLLSKQRKCLTAASFILVASAYITVTSASYIFKNDGVDAFMFIFSTLVFFILEFIFQSYKKGFEKSTLYFQQNVLRNQYEEIKNIYLSMRGWRHDYHSHLQIIKAHLALNQMDEVQKYLLELEQDLSRVDYYVKSGNLMADAILNSKISIAKTKNIKIVCKAELPENLSVTDIDMCVILGNLLDNAIEACMKIDDDKRFIRIYIAVLKNQLYMSVQNSAKDELDFNERSYISNKRGEHGLGVKRVKILIDKYNGYLNLQNEPGIFASEATIPLMGN